MSIAGALASLAVEKTGFIKIVLCRKTSCYAWLLFRLELPASINYFVIASAKSRAGSQVLYYNGDYGSLAFNYYVYTTLSINCILQSFINNKNHKEMLLHTFIVRVSFDTWVILDKHVPMITRTIIRPANPWYTSQIAGTMNLCKKNLNMNSEL